MAKIVEELDNGVVVTQVTEDTCRKENIYCELPWCDKYSHGFVYRQQTDDGGPNGSRYLYCKFGTWETEEIGQGLGSCGITFEGIFFYRRVAKRKQEFVRVNLTSGESRVIYEFPEDFAPKGNITASPDERYYAYGVALGFDPVMFGIELVDLHGGTREVINTDPEICNPHTHFEPTHGKWVMVQHNRGCAHLQDGTRTRLVGPEGATEYLVSIPDGEVTRLPVGTPHTPGITGHEAWISGKDEILMSVRAHEDYAPKKGNLIGVTATGEVRRVGIAGIQVNHVGTTPDGRFFSVDDWRGTSKLVIGSTTSGRSRVICEARTSMSQSQDTHGHPYLSPDARWLVYNSDSSGHPQIHVASIPALITSDILSED
ncbi:TPA: hypothetical protein DCE37_12160 [Candidatus Latescibacteria bacterium]|nr:hypothetical protein [Candidatus Latescibacterota bacterium]